jgi:peptide/nickel transport system permease protein
MMHRFRSQPRATKILLGVVAAFVVLAIIGPYIAPRDPMAIGSVNEQLRSPSWSHPFGTDQVGRDVFSRVVAGARASFTVSAAVVVLAVTAGTILGLLAGLGNRVVDESLMRVTDMFFAFPYLILAMAVVASLGPGDLSLILALSVIWWPSYARQVRGHVLAVKSSPFVDASRIVGNGKVKTALRHILPQMYSELGVRMTLDLGNVILIASALGFLGLGARPPSPEWGSILFEAKAYTLEAWWMSIFPGLALTFSVLLFSLCGDSLHSRPRIIRRATT